VIAVSPTGAITVNGFINTSSNSGISGSVSLDAAGTIGVLGINTGQPIQ